MVHSKLKICTHRNTGKNINDDSTQHSVSYCVRLSYIFQLALSLNTYMSSFTDSHRQQHLPTSPTFDRHGNISTPQIIQIIQIYTVRVSFSKALMAIKCIVEIFTSNSKRNPLNTELNPICHLLALLGPPPILHISRIRDTHTCLLFHTHKIKNCI